MHDPCCLLPLLTPVGLPPCARAHRSRLASVLLPDCLLPLLMHIPCLLAPPSPRASQETLGIGPAWLSNSIVGFRDGAWAGPGEAGLGHTTAVGHVHHWPHISSWHKTVVRKVRPPGGLAAPPQQDRARPEAAVWREDGGRGQPCSLRCPVAAQAVTPFVPRTLRPAATPHHPACVSQMVGRYNWSLGALTAPLRTPYTSGYKVERVLALHPSIDLSRTRTMTEYLSITLGLIQVRERAMGGGGSRLILAATPC